MRKRKHLFPYNHRRCHKQPFQIPKMKAQQLPTFLRTSIDLRIPIRLLMGGTPAKKEIIHNLFSTTSIDLYKRIVDLNQLIVSLGIVLTALISHTLKIEVLLSLKEILGARLTEKKKKTLLGWDNKEIRLKVRNMLSELKGVLSVVVDGIGYLQKIVEQSPFSLSG
ncbi:hypothetical protein ACJX0J_003816 (mitochondrion) [Zea mays]